MQDSKGVQDHGSRPYVMIIISKHDQKLGILRLWISAPGETIDRGSYRL